MMGYRVFCNARLLLEAIIKVVVSGKGASLRAISKNKNDVSRGTV